MSKRFTAKLAAVAIAVSGIVGAAALPAAAASQGAAKTACVNCWGPSIR